MIIKEMKIGMFIKDGIRYAVRPDDGQTREEAVAEAIAAGYVRQPMTEAERTNATSEYQLEIAKNAKKREIASARYNAELSSVTLPNGLVVDTDVKTRLALSAGVMQVMQDPTFVFENYKMPDGSFMDFDATAITQVYGAVMQFVSGCFNTEKLLNDAINAATTIEEVEAITWSI